MQATSESALTEHLANVSCRSGTGRSLRFCMVTTFYPPYNFGGDGIFVQRLSQALVQRGHQVTVVHCADAYRISGGDAQVKAIGINDGVTVHTLKHCAGHLSPLVTHQLGTPGLKRGLLKDLLDNDDFDVIHFHNVSLIGGPGILSYGDAIKLYTAHEHWLVCPLSTLWTPQSEPCEKQQCTTCTLRSGRPPQLWRHTGYLEKQLSSLDCLIYPSEFSARKHQQFGMHHPYTVLANFLPLAQESTVLTSEELANQRPYFLMVGRLEQSKGFHRVIKHFQQRNDADLVLVGTGNYEETLATLAAEHEHITLQGHLPYEQLPGLYRDARAVIVPSLWDEPFGLIVLEAFAQATPVVVNRAGALPELIEASGGGFVYDEESVLSEALDKLISDEKHAAELGQKGYAAYRTYWTDEVHLEQYFALIKSLESTTTVD